MAAGLVGAALFYGDGVITPAISVLSAVEGLKVATPFFDPYVVPISVVLLTGLFLNATPWNGAVGRLFGPVMLALVAVLALLGYGASSTTRASCWRSIRSTDSRCFSMRRGPVSSCSERFPCGDRRRDPLRRYGAFGRNALRTAWIWLVFPALLLNYFGQGGGAARQSDALEHPFYRLVARMGPLSARGFGDGRDDHRLNRR